MGPKVSVLLSIHPEWCYAIESGEKTVEVRKTKPKLEVPFKCYIYCTKEDFPKIVTDWSKSPFGKVIGEFVCDKITCSMDSACGLAGVVDCEKFCLYPKEIMGDGKYSLHISKLEIYEQPKPLHEFYKPGAEPMEELGEELCNHCCKTDYGAVKQYHDNYGVWFCDGIGCDKAYKEYLRREGYTLKRPPQSWCYVDEGVSV